MRTSTRRPRAAADDGTLARGIGSRLREARRRAGLTQQQLAGERYTKAYVSALENALVRPSMVALNYFAERLNVAPSRLLSDDTPVWSRLQADLFLASGRWQEAVDAYTALLEADPDGDPTLQAEQLRGRAEALTRLNRGAPAATDAAAAARQFEAAGRATDAALAQYWLAYAQYEQENHEEAISLLQAVLAAIRGGLQVQPDFTVRVLMALSSVESVRGLHARALAYLEEVRGLSEDLDDRRRATFYFDLAASYRETGDLEAAISAGHKSLALFRASESELEIAELENHLALAYLGLGNLPRAAELAAAARAQFVRLHDERWLAHADDTAAQVALAEQRPQAALELTERALDTARRTDNQKAMGSALVTRARAYAALGDPASASSCYEQAAALARESGARGQLRDVLGQWADLMAASGDHARAYELSREALTSG